MQIIHRFLVAGVIVFGVATGCKKDKSSGKINIEGFHRTDASGMDLGHQGPADDDWTTKPGTGMSAEIAALFNFETDRDVSQTTEATINRILAFPNPFANTQRYIFDVSKPTLLKIVLVDNELRVLDKNAVVLYTGGNSIASFDFSDRIKYPNKGAFRLYYSFSAIGKPNYQYGWGDIKICESNTGDCF